MLPTLARKFENLKIEEKSRGEIANLGMKIQRSEKKKKNCYFPLSYMDFTQEVDCCSGKSVSEGGLYPPRVSLAASSEARAVIETQGG